MLRYRRDFNKVCKIAISDYQFCKNCQFISLSVCLSVCLFVRLYCISGPQGDGFCSH